MDAIKKQLPSGNEVRVALDRWTSIKKLAISWSLLTKCIEIGHCMKYNLLAMRFIAYYFLVLRAT